MKALTLLEAKDQIAKKYGLQSWDEDIYRDISFHWKNGSDYKLMVYEDLYDEVATLYAQSCCEKVQEDLISKIEHNNKFGLLTPIETLRKYKIELP